MRRESNAPHVFYAHNGGGQTAPQASPRRNRWFKIKVGEILWAVEKSQGLKKGEKVVKIDLIVVISERWEALNAITQEDVIEEGFPDWTPEQFIAFYCEHNGGDGSQSCHRIEFDYVTPLVVDASGNKHVVLRRKLRVNKE